LWRPQTIRTNERPSILARWESGRRILTFYQADKKQLASGMLDAIAHELGVVRSEVCARIKFAKKVPEAELSTFVESHTSWTAIHQKALIDKPRKSSAVPPCPLRQAFDILDNVDPLTLNPADLKLIEDIHERRADDGD
jgi:hypothetical protein